MQQTNINTLVVQIAQFIPILLFVSEMAYPAPALAFSNTLITNDIVFQQTVTSVPDLESIRPLKNGLLLHLVATAYTSQSSLTDASPLITASGTTAHDGIIATNILPLHTKVSINSKVFTVEDRMNSRYDHTLIVDIWMPTLEEAQAFGVRQVYARIESLPE